jgi:glycosyltransferase involved in cell wall biosynthesis
MKPKIKVAFASGTDDLNLLLMERMRAAFPELPLYVVSEFPPEGPDLIWIRYRGSFSDNLARCRSAFRGKSIRLAGVLLVPNVPFRRMRLLALMLAPLYFLAVNENLNDFMLRPGSLPAIFRHFAWRTGNFIRWHAGKNGFFARRGWHDAAYLAARIAGWRRPGTRNPGPVPSGLPDPTTPDGPAYYSLFTDRTQSLTLRYRAWQAGRPSFSPAPGPGIEDIPVTAAHLAFLAQNIADRNVFRHHWARALRSLHANAETSLLWQAAALALPGGPRLRCDLPEEAIFALTNGGVAVYPGRAASGKPRILIASAYLPFPLSHGGAVRIHNLTKRVTADWDQILICFTETGAAPPPELLEIFVEVILVRRMGTHLAADSARPEIVEEFASPAFRGALRQAVRKWQPRIAQLEFTHMAQYAPDCAPALPVLVEHDITFDLCTQMAREDDDWDLHRELERWRRFETSAWRDMACVVTMSAKDQALITGARAVTLPNGVDPDRFRVTPLNPENRRILFVGSFSHLPNMMAVAFFLDRCWPKIRATVPGVQFHIIAGANHEYFLDYQSRRVRLDLNQPGIAVDGFVSDVRPAYEQAAIVIAPLVASAGTNLKIPEAMACGRPVVSTPAGVNGLDLTAGAEFVLAETGEEMADAIVRLFASPGECERLAAAGRRRVEESYGWDEIARKQTELYRDLSGSSGVTPDSPATAPESAPR